ncbi:response regulator [Hymenobacter sp. ASUV-10]|uniref:Response regulator n=1 Tax=Hymenobacter aranciens TaxID=3063996 RepID=A0ABT9BH52_9BACT|nr:response regulator [Hymenobacter sp. ASUV-10]MDO7877576.1 response regulator [Hymenobacter sp. ASUV-10]
MKTPTPLVVLLVENDPLWGILLTELLQQLGATVLGPAATAAQARALCAAGPPPALAVLDIGLDGPENGLQLGRWLQQHRAMPLLYFTSEERAAISDEVWATDPLAFIPKSSPAEELRQRLSHALDQARHPDRLKVRR